MYMLDTNAIIMAIRHPDWTISRKIKEHIGIDLCISAITYGELEYGIMKSSAPARNRIAIMNILLGIKILDFDTVAASHFGDIFADLEKREMRISDRDTMIAAHARSQGHILITDNLVEFSRVEGLKYENWK